MSSSHLNLACVADSTYLGYALGLFLSAKQVHGKHFTFHLQLVNTTELPISDGQLQVYPIQCNYQHTNPTPREEYDNEFIAHYPATDSPLVSDLARFCNNARFRFLSRLLDARLDNIVMLDADMLFNQTILPLSFSVTDVALQPYWDGTHQKYCVEFLFVKNNPRTQTFFKSFAERIELEFGLLKWGHAAFFTSALCTSNLRILPISDLYRDSKFRPNACLWTGEDYRKMRQFTEPLNQAGYLNKLKSLLENANLSHLYRDQ